MDLTAAEDAAKEFAAGSRRCAVATVTDAGGNQTLEVRKDKDKNYYAKSSRGRRHVQSRRRSSATRSTRASTTSATRSSSTSASATPARCDLKGATYTKSGDKWMSGGKTMDNASVQNLIDKLRDLAATKFVEAGRPESRSSRPP